MSPTQLESGAVRPVRAGKALSIMQPWTWLIANRHKPIENRNWYCSYRGPVLLHAGKKIDREAEEELRAGYHPVTGRRLELDLPETFETGGIVGEAVIADCVERSNDPWFVGRFGIVMRDARPLPFIPCKGARSFFIPDLPDAVSGVLDRAADTPLPKPAPALAPTRPDPQTDLFATQEQP